MADYFRIEQDQENIVWLHLDMPDSGANVLTADALAGLERALDEIKALMPKGLVLLSDKKSGFVAGADVKAFAQVQDVSEAATQIRHAHAVFQRLENMACPTLALIHGYCLGGGLELALACQYRVVRDDEATRLGFPEVRLGLFPGFGGSVRSLQRIGHLKAMQMMLSGRSVSGRRAKQMGLATLAVPQRQLKAAAIQVLRQQPAAKPLGLVNGIVGNALIRPLMAKIFYRQTAKLVNPAHYPAPFALIEHWQKYAQDADAMYESEVLQVSRLLTGNTAQNLIRVFLLQDELKKLGTGHDFLPDSEAAHVHVVGGGVMGGDIAAWCALKGLVVTLQDREPKYLTRAIQRAHQLFKKKLKNRYSVQAAMDRLIADHGSQGIAKADVVIEAIYEDADAKKALYRNIEPRMKAGAILATNTSSIPLQQLSSDLANPERLVGLHFFNPVAKMPLLEIVAQPLTEAVTINKALAFAHRIGKLPIPVTSTPGFLVNRVLMPYLLEAVKQYEEGIEAVIIDLAAEDFGMPMGPIELADTVGLDICLSVAEKISETDDQAVPSVLKQLVGQQKLGRKNKQGFYQWKKGKALKPKSTKPHPPLSDLADRMIMRLIEEAQQCLDEGVVENAELLDAGVIFGTGFAPFTGGPMHYMKTKENIDG